MAEIKNWWDAPFPRSSMKNPSEVLGAWCIQELVRRSLSDGRQIERFSAEGQFDGDVEQLFTLARELGGKIVTNDITFDPESKKRKATRGGFSAAWPEGYAYLSLEADGWSDVSISTLDPVLGKTIVEKFSPLLKKRGRKREVYVLVSTEDGYDMSSLGAHGLALERGNYNAAALESYDHVISDLQEKMPCGRIVIIEGPPGTGKTHLIRGMIQEAKDTTFVLIPPTMIAGISGPNVIQALVGWRRSSTGAIVFVLEDADAVLATRQMDNMNAVNEILNLGDGILGAALDIRIVATTNAARVELDKAITRDGRLCRRMEVGPLSEEESVTACKRIGVPTDTGVRTLAEIYGLKKGLKKKAEEPAYPSSKRAGF